MKKVKSVQMDDVSIEDILELTDGMGPDELRYVMDSLPPHVVSRFWDYLQGETGPDEEPIPAPANPLLQAQEIEAKYRSRPHLEYLANRIAKGVERVEAGENVFIRVSMPPRMGKSVLSSTFTPAWILRKHPDWKIGLISHSPDLAVSWGRQVRDLIEEHEDVFGLQLKKGSSSVQRWFTTRDGEVTSRSIRESITGLGFKVLIIDDAVKDFADAHSATQRNFLWNWWVANAFTRLEEPFMVIVVGTRWHEDDFIGRLKSAEYDGDPSDWEVIEFPAIAEEDDVLGREPGQPLLSPLTDETAEEALERWERIKRAVGTYAWSALYQQRPAPSKGAIFDTDWWKFWTSVPQLASKTEDGELDPNGKIVYINPDEDLKTARWLDSWDCAFKGAQDSDYVVGQRWAQRGATKFLIYQHRARMTFTRTLEKMKDWANVLLSVADGGAPHSHLVHERLVEDKANGTAVIDTLKEKISGLVPINPTDSKEGRARSVTPEIEAGNVRLPLPSQPGNEWVTDYITEFREFPTGSHDDQVDGTTQALSRMRTPMKASVTVPGRVRRMDPSRRGQAAATQRRITRAGGR